MSANEAPAAQRQYLTFLLDGEEYAVRILGVKAVIELCRITPVPLMPPCVRGVISLRGTVIPVVDLAVKFGGGGTNTAKRHCIVIVEPETGEELEGERTQVGLIAQAVGRVVEFDDTDVTQPPPFGTKVQASYLFGLGRTAEGFVMILDIDRALSTQELLSEAQQAAALGGPDGLAAGSDIPHAQEAAAI